jgi:ribosome recycling factor
MLYKQLIDELKEKMQKGVAHFHEETKGLRSGRATPALVENLRVDYYGSPTPLKNLASITIPEPRSLMIKPFDVSAVKEIERAIQKSELGITPQSDGKVVRLTVPELSEEQRNKLVARIKEMSEQTKVALRNLRRDQLKKVEESEQLTDDDVEKAKDEVQKVLKGAEAEVDAFVATKKKEILDS